MTMWFSASCWTLVPILLVTYQERGRSGPAPGSSRIKSTVQIAAEAAPAIVTVLALNGERKPIGQGSGIIVRSDGVLVTNWHVLAGASFASVRLASGEQFDRVTFLDGDAATDIALIKIPGYQLPTVRTTAEIPSVGAKAVAIGSPLGLAQTVSDGIVSSVRLMDGKQWVQMSTPISPGSSGGAVLDERGDVFAISTASQTGGQQLNFAVPVRYALGLLSSARTERPIAEMFAPAATPAPANPAATTAASMLPARTARPRKAIEGIFAIDQVTTSAGTANVTFRQRGVLMRRDDVGLLMLGTLRPDNELTDRRVYAVRSLRTTGAGDVMVETAAYNYTGYQTDEGFVVSARVRGLKGEVDVWVQGQPYELDAGESSGLYNVAFRSRYVRQGVDRGYVDWNGVMAVALVDGSSLHVDLSLKNPQWGTTRLAGMTPIASSGAFTLTVGSKSLRGTLRSGVLDARWEELRDQGAVTGTFRAERR